MNTVYLIKLVHPTRTRTYIGFTTDFKHRLRQHNNEIKGGAKCTTAWSSQGFGWELVCMVSGFASRSSALSFESTAKRFRISRVPSEQLVGLWHAEEWRGLHVRVKSFLCLLHQRERWHDKFLGSRSDPPQLTITWGTKNYGRWRPLETTLPQSYVAESS